MAFSAFRRILSGSSAPSPLLRSCFASLRPNSTLLGVKVSAIERMVNRFSNRIPFGLSRVTTDENLYNAFASFGRLREAKVIMDRASGRSKGFGFVTYETVEEAEKAREGMNAKFLDGWVIFVDPARPREAQPRQPPRQDMQFNSQSTDMGFTTNKTIGWCG